VLSRAGSHHSQPIMLSGHSLSANPDVPPPWSSTPGRPTVAVAPSTPRTSEVRYSPSSVQVPTPPRTGRRWATRIVHRFPGLSISTSLSFEPRQAGCGIPDPTYTPRPLSYLSYSRATGAPSPGRFRSLQKSAVDSARRPSARAPGPAAGGNPGACRARRRRLYGACPVARARTCRRMPGRPGTPGSRCPTGRTEATGVPAGCGGRDGRPPGVGSEGLDERPGEPLQAGGRPPPQARADLGIVEQFVQPDAEPTPHQAPPVGGRHPPTGFVPNALPPVRRGTQ
jgi:hypothetical protein